MRFFLLAVALSMACLFASATNFPPLTVPNGMGVNIHFTGEPARDLDMIRDAGWQFIRMDFFWEGIEREKGVYDFSAYDLLTDGLLQRDIRPLYILDYSHPLYEKDRSVRTEEGRQAFARFAAAAAAHYKGKPILWELWNEPNIGFWQPVPNPEDYVALAKATFPAIRAADPAATCVAPATAGMDFTFLENCFRLGLLSLIDGVTMHPYRQSMPETVVNDYAKLRALIAHYSPDRQNIPILSGEWGYSTVWNKFDDVRQGQYLPRQYMINLSQHVPVSIWYDWHDDGPDPKEPEHHFGTVTQDYQPKPSYLAALRLVKALRGMHFVKRLQSNSEDYLFLFRDGSKFTIAAWTTGDAHQAEVFAGKQVELTGDPQYLSVPATATAILAEGAWTATPNNSAVFCGPGETRAAPAFTVAVQNPFTRPVPVTVAVTDAKGLTGTFTAATKFTAVPGKAITLAWKGKNPVRRDAGELSLVVTVTVDGHRSQQTVKFTVANPLTVQVLSMRDSTAAAVLSLNELEKFNGTLVALIGQRKVTLQLARNAAGKYMVTANGKPVMPVVAGSDLYLPLPGKINFATETVRLQLYQQKQLVVDSGAYRVQPVEVSTQTAQTFNDGSADVPATFSLTDTTYADPAIPAEHGVKFTYEYGKGWKFVRIAPRQTVTIDRMPKTLGVWVRGNETGCRLNMRIVDRNGRFFQPSFGILDFDGWRFMTVRLDDSIGMGIWGGNGGDPAMIDYPATLDTFILVDGTQSPLQGDVEFANFQLVFTE